MRDHEDVSAFQALILALLMEDETSAEEVTTKKLDSDMASVDTHGARPERRH
jgi:hypothetical protein